MSSTQWAIHSFCLALSVVGLAVQAPALAGSVPFWGAKASVPIDTPINQLKKGEYLWMGEAVTTGPVVMVVSITEQRAYVYRNGVLIGATTVSTGRSGHPTPTGVFTVLQKQKEHRSTIYDGAPMPYMERLTWGGVALHAGGLPGYPESHGCIHLPSEFAQRLFEISPNGMTVVIGTEATAPEPVAEIRGTGKSTVDKPEMVKACLVPWYTISPSPDVNGACAHLAASSSQTMAPGDSRSAGLALHVAAPNAATNCSGSNKSSGLFMEATLQRRASRLAHAWAAR
jgi:hypothetical protein